MNAREQVNVHKMSSHYFLSSALCVQDESDMCECVYPVMNVCCFNRYFHIHIVEKKDLQSRLFIASTTTTLLPTAAVKEEKAINSKFYKENELS
jgi:hypothetical protein